MHRWLILQVVSSCILVKLGETTQTNRQHLLSFISPAASLINAFVALLGYYAAAALVDDPDCGRLVLQQTGLIITGALFILCGCLNDRLSSTWLVIMYFGSSFFGE